MALQGARAASLREDWFPNQCASARQSMGGRCGRGRPAEILSRLSRLFFSL